MKLTSKFWKTAKQEEEKKGVRDNSEQWQRQTESLLHPYKELDK